MTGLYVIVRHECGGAVRFVTPPGNERSTSDRLQDAWFFTDVHRAGANRCPDNETVMSLEEVLTYPIQRNW